LIRCVVFDFDMTLVDSSQLKPSMDGSKWGEVFRNLHKTSVYSGVKEALNELHDLGIECAIASNAPKGYIEKILKYHKINFSYILGYHDVTMKKPSPESLEKCISHFNIQSNECVYIGDNETDYLTANNAGVKFFGVEWGEFAHLQISKFSYFDFVKDVLGLVDTSLEDNVINNDFIVNQKNHYYIGYYDGKIKNKVLDFKDDKNNGLKQWSLLLNEIAEYLPKVDIVLRALGHNELVTKKNNLCTLSEIIAKKIGADYLPSFLKKSQATLKSTKLSRPQRYSQINGLYESSNDFQSKKDISFLIVDDVFTTGATTNEIARALHQTHPNAKIYIFTLVKTLLSRDSHQSIYQNKRLLKLFDIVSEKQSLVLGDKFKDKVSKSFSANYSNTNHNFIVQNISSYSVVSESERSKYLPAIYILKNMLQRGKPSLFSRFLQSKLGNINFDHFDSCENALIDHKNLNWHRIIKGDTASNFIPAKKFYDELIGKYLGEFSFIKNLIIPEVKLFDITQVYVESLYNQYVDFYLPQAALIIEIDGQQHIANQQNDNFRDSYARKYGVETLRLTTSEISTENKSFQDKMKWLISFLEKEVISGKQRVKDKTKAITLGDYKQSVLKNRDYSAPNLVATAIMRLQIVLLELLESGDLTLTDHWNFEIKCRDTKDFAEFAIEDISLWLSNLLSLQNIEFAPIKYSIKYLDEKDAFSSKNTLKIDFSLCQRFTDEFQTNPDIIYVRTHYLDEYKVYNSDDSNSINGVEYRDYDHFQLSTSAPIKYSFKLGDGSPHQASLEFFLENLFLPNIENVSFREGQLGIITSALMRNDTIGLLPTGSGKSICYQLAAILQPAVSFVVCPIKSLMYDQKIDLDSVKIERTNFISSDQTAAEKERVQSEFSRGKYFFIYISPERFQSKAFRQELLKLNNFSTFAYAVIDEVHCLSEWGHDFRISYLNLANAINKFAPDSTYIGLTATASVNVLKDIQSEFHINDVNVKTPLKFTREELYFDVINDQGNKDEALKKLAWRLKLKWQQEPENKRKCGIIFTPHVNGDKGCHPLAGSLSTELNEEVHYYSGSVPKDFGNPIMSNGEFELYKKKVQKGFKSNDYHMLTATKAFGMGVNKGNIAFTIHYGMPGSMEALYQEAGRAGRDKLQFVDEPADCVVLLSPENYTKINELWSPDITVEELKKHQVTLKNSKSDINTNLFMFLNGLDTINDDFKLLKLLYRTYYHHDGDLTQIIDSKVLSFEKSKVQKAIYRLVQIGIVSDWTVDNFYSGTYEVEFVRHGEQTVKIALEETIHKYDSDFKISNLLENPTGRFKTLVKMRWDNKFTELEFYFVVLLLWSYEHFAYNRRQSLKNVYEQCLSLSNGNITNSEFKIALENYFRFNESSYLLQHIADNPHEFERWFDVFYETKEDDVSEDILTTSELNAVKDQLSRFLESYMSNVGLNFISGVIRLILDDFDDPDGRNRLTSSLIVINDYSEHDRLKIIEQLLKIITPQLSDKNKNELTMTMHEVFDDENILRVLNSHLNDEFSLSTLLEYKLNKIKGLTSLMKDTVCQFH